MKNGENGDAIHEWELYFNCLHSLGQNGNSSSLFSFLFSATIR